MTASLASAIMETFAEATGVIEHRPPRRYLWTDALAVCNFLGLARRTGDDRYLTLARRLVDQVHHVLGRHRTDDVRSGWISGLEERVGERHPTMRGLRIGKPLPERKATEKYDAEREWNRDGQYFHYLTKWAHALCRMERETGETRYHDWAGELMAVAHRSFTFVAGPEGAKRMVWKMSIDLTRPLVSSMGDHDPLDGLITCLEIRQPKQVGSNGARSGILAAMISDMTTMCGHRRWVTDDPLGIGGLLDAAARLVRLIDQHGVDHRDLLERMLFDAEESLQRFAHVSVLDRPAKERLAFRELGLAIGLRGLSLIQRMAVPVGKTAVYFNRLLGRLSLADRIERFWADASHRHNAAWTDHADINSVMLATSLVPEGYFDV
jgi:hypothetical protein